MTTWQREIAQARSVGDILVEEEALSKTDLERAKALADERDKCVEEILHEEKMVTEEMLQRAIADHYRVPTEEQFSLSIFTADGFARMVKPVLRMLFGEKKANFCAFKLSCRAERRHRKVLQKQALLEAKIAEEKEARKHRSQAKKNAKESKSFESILLAEKKARTKISPLQSIQTWMKNRKEIQAKVALEKARRKEEQAALKQKEEEAKVAAKEQAKAEQARIKAEKAAARKEGARAQREAMKAFLKRPSVAFRAWQEKQRILKEERIAQKAALQEQKRLAREQAVEQKHLAHEARIAEKKAKREAFLAKFTWRKKEVKKESDEGKEEARLTEEARKEARKQVMIEQEKRKIKEELGEPAGVVMQIGGVVAGGSATGMPVATLQAPAGSTLQTPQAGTPAPTGGTSNATQAEEKRLAEEKKILEEERKSLAEERARLLEEKQKTVEASEVEKEIIREKARREAEEKFAAEMAKTPTSGAKGTGSPALEEELHQWKKQAEKLEQEKKAMEQQRLLQEEEEKIRKEQRQIEEEKILFEKQRLEREHQDLAEKKAHQERLSEEKEALERARQSLEETKKEEEASLKKEPAPTLPKPVLKKRVVKKGEEQKEREKKSGSTFDIGKILLAQNYLDEKELADAEELAHERNVPVEHVLKDEGLVTKELLQNAIAEYYKIPFVDLRSQPPDSSVIELLPETFSIAFNAVAVQKNDDGSLLVATSSPEQETLIAEIKKLLPQVPSIALAYAPKESIESALTFYRKPLDTRFRKILEEHKKIAPEIIEEIFSDAVQLGASDIHFEPQEKIVIVRFRVDGVMHEAGRIPKEYYEGIINRIKIAGNMRIDEHFTAQDGAIRWKSGEKSMDVRVSIVPIVDGEKIVMRLLSEYVRTLTLSDLGFTPTQREVLIKAAHKPFGMLLTTGPTGSGKSTTLYGLMKTRNTPDVNISTIEDPVEYKIPGINHIQVNVKTDLTFERGLRALVRQDPDIILVGEIRDNITAQISVNAALTGHLLFSTLHANDAATAVPRLLEMGIEPYLLASTLELIIAQRLMRRVCLNCRYSYNISRKEACSLFHNAEHYFSAQERLITLYRGKGCAACGDTGYKGRVGVYELLVVTQELEDLIVQRRTTADINDMARRQGMLTLFEDGLQKVKNGLSTIEELMRIAAPPDVFMPTVSPTSHEPILPPKKE